MKFARLCAASIRGLLKSLTSILVFVGTLAAANSANAAGYPERPITMVIPFGAGGGTDAFGRGLAAEMSKLLGQQIVIQNIGGASGTIGTTKVAGSAKDGYTIGLIPIGPLTIQPHLLKLPYSVDSFDPICMIYSNPQAVIVRSDSPFKNTPEMIAWAKQNPGKLLYGSSGVGTIPHLAAAALVKAAGIEAVHVPHKGDADNMVSLLGGHVMMFVSHTAVLASHASSVRSLGLMAGGRLKEYPDLPTLAEQGAPALNFDVWGGLFAPKGTPPAVVTALENACKQGTSSDTYRKLLISLQTPFNYMDSAAFTKFVNAEFERNARVAAEAGMKREP